MIVTCHRFIQTHRTVVCTTIKKNHKCKLWTSGDFVMSI